MAVALVVSVASGVEPGGVIDVAEAGLVASVTAAAVPAKCGVPAQPVRPANSEQSSQKLTFGAAVILRKSSPSGVMAMCFILLRR
jgi:hypothetical protein